MDVDPRSLVGKDFDLSVWKKWEFSQSTWGHIIGTTLPSLARISWEVLIYRRLCCGEGEGFGPWWLLNLALLGVKRIAILCVS